MRTLHRPAYKKPSFRSTWNSSTGIALKADERDVNRAVAALGSSDREELRWAIVRMITPNITERDLDDRSRIPYVIESGASVDWVVGYPDTGVVLGICEHKPLGAPAHGSWASHDLLFDETAVKLHDGYRAEVNANLHILDLPVFTDDQLSRRLRYYTYKEVSGGRKSSMDQVLKYRADFGGRLPCHILSDQGTTVNDIYRSRGRNALHRPYEYVEDAFPVHTTAQALDYLAHALEGVPLTKTEEEDVTQVVDAMWMRGPRHINRTMTDSAKKLVSNAAHDAGYNPDIRWTRDTEEPLTIADLA